MFNRSIHFVYIRDVIAKLLGYRPSNGKIQIISETPWTTTQERKRPRASWNSHFETTLQSLADPDRIQGFHDSLRRATCLTSKSCAMYQRRSLGFKERTAIFTHLADALFLCWGGWIWYHLMHQIVYFQAARVFFPPFPKRKSVPVVTSHWLTCFQGFSHKRSTCATITGRWRLQLDIDTLSTQAVHVIKIILYFITHVSSHVTFDGRPLWASVLAFYVHLMLKVSDNRP